MEEHTLKIRAVEERIRQVCEGLDGVVVVAVVAAYKGEQDVLATITHNAHCRKCAAELLDIALTQIEERIEESQKSN